MKNCYFSLKSMVGLLIYGCAFVSTSTQAVSISPGETVPLFGTTADESPQTAGPIIGERVANFAVDVDGTMVTGAVSQRLRSFQDFGLVIDYRITSFDDQGLGLEIEGLSTQSFELMGGFDMDVDYRLDEPGDISPVTASWGQSVAFDFGSSPLLAGETSLWMFVADPNNDLVTFGNYGAQLLALTPTGKQVSIPFQSYVTFIPIPASLPLMASGLVGLLGMARRKESRG